MPAPPPLPRPCAGGGLLAASALLLACSAAAAPCAAAASPPAADAAAPRLDVEVWHNASEGYAAYRIPGLSVLPGGVLVAVAEGRARAGFHPPGGDTSDCYGAGASAADYNCTNKDVVIKRSLDGGRSWGASAAVPLCLADAAFFYSDPQLLYVPARGALWLEYARCAVATHFRNCSLQLAVSADGGVTWSPRAAPPHAPTLSGTSGGILTSSGRLLFPNAGAGVFYSDDAGASWAAGAPVADGAGKAYRGENMVAELPDGRLLMTMRRKNNTRVLFTSADGGETWAGPAPQAVTDPDCQASLLATTSGGGGGKPRALLFANPHTSGLLPYALGRQNVTVQRSVDGAGAVWTPLLLVRPGPSAYTALAQLAPSGAASCGILYEESADLPIDFRSIRFAAFDCDTGA